MLDWDDIHTFLAIARHGSLSAAARALKVSQSTMSRRLDHLHGRVGATLLERTPTGFRLTAGGSAILDQATQMEDAALALERTIAGDDQRLEGIVRVTAVETFAAHILTVGIALLHATHPGISIELITDNRSLSLARREADIAVRLGRFDAHETIVRKIGDMAFGVYASSGYLDRFGAPDRSTAGEGHRIVRVQDDLVDTPDARWFSARFPKAEVALFANSREVQMRAVAQGVGLGFLPCYAADTVDGLVRVPTSEPVMREIWMGVHRDTRHAPRIQAVQMAILEAVTQETGRLRPR
ncbi:transcriptional regulator, LysR family [Sphingobium sp. AP50]|uniref:LysR family transcriptional regulator n=1 Tax=Sphingobium sp. AP50 TaxID=1884369 RepID=UPI0008BA7BB8|nr:LysR family transcriptional regulator [Sphingobium sp. AP50]SEJ50470.1 transcriptional regulator, LysR family [Sphingobium sp. AP50]